ncbi:class I mannose-6-phosphate isomerase [uncultured Microbacterium sp.]|uniref:class I mannose-6-phosphate isomerase n=1 Tax=uncultured Microbacterium sp. TaxID=191216 RepID=UPI0025FBF6C1|nr:class I mannose-6-phosphate isomerase [uncultured Microbacterium sp.]
MKLLDAGQRLPIRAHPDDAFAAAHLGRAHGKAEAWYILSGGTVHLGLREDVDLDRLAQMVARQRTEELLALLHRVEVHPGDVVWVPPGELHAIGEGVLLLELQQPEDLSILLEWRGFALDGAADGHVGIGFDRALTAVTRRARSAAEIAELVHPAPREHEGSVFPAEADAYFRLERRVVEGAAVVSAGFAVVVVTDGDVMIGGAPARAGTTWLVAAAEGDVVVSGRGELLIARSPAP